MSTNKRKKKHKTITEFNKKTIVAKCCNPFPDDDFGLHKRSKNKYVIHTIDCLKKQGLEYISIDADFTKTLKNKEFYIDFISNQKENLLKYIKENIKNEGLLIKQNRIYISLNFSKRKDWDKLKSELSIRPEVLDVKLI